MATYKSIQDRVKQQAGFVPKTCWIADLKSKYGQTTRTAPNRQGTKRIYPCPPEKRAAIESAFRFFGMI